MGLAVNYPIQPSPACFVVGGIGPESVHKNIDVREYHGLLVTSSKSHDRLRSTPGRTPPVALDTGKWTRFDEPGLRSARISAKPSSMRDVSVRPSSNALFLARFKSSSFILTVVLIHQNIFPMHQYVKDVGIVQFQSRAETTVKRMITVMSLRAKRSNLPGLGIASSCHSSQ